MNRAKAGVDEILPSRLILAVFGKAKRGGLSTILPLSSSNHQHFYSLPASILLIFLIIILTLFKIFVFPLPVHIPLPPICFPQPPVPFPS